MSVNNILFVVTGHSVELGKQVVEIRDRDNGALLGTITQADKINTVRFLSRHDLRLDQPNVTSVLPVKMAVVEIEVKL